MARRMRTLSRMRFAWPRNFPSAGLTIRSSGAWPHCGPFRSRQKYRNQASAALKNVAHAARKRATGKRTQRQRYSMTDQNPIIALLFPGQGSQSVGMGKDLYEQYPIARQTFEEADDALGYKLSTVCFEGPE